MKVSSNNSRANIYVERREIKLIVKDLIKDSSRNQENRSKTKDHPDKDSKFVQKDKENYNSKNTSTVKSINIQNINKMNKVKNI